MTDFKEIIDVSNQDKYNDEIVALWEQLDYIEEDKDYTAIKFIEIKKQIEKQKVLRYRRRVITISSVAAIILLTLLIYIDNFKNNDIADSVVFNSEISEIDAIKSKVTLEVGSISYDINTKYATLSHNKNRVSIITGSDENIKPVCETEILILNVPAGHQFNMTLSDGTKVWLNSNSTLTYPAKFDNKSRNVKITGEAYFEVVKDEKSPFIVSVSDNYYVNVLGTSFNVDSYANNEASKVTLISGKVKVAFKDNDNEVDLLPLEQLEYNSKEIVVKKVDIESVISWREKIFIFSNTKLSEIARSMSRCYGIDVVVNNRYVNIRFSGRVSYDKGINYFIKVLKETERIECKLIDGTLYIGSSNY